MNIHISGNLRGPTAFFLAGWPDSGDVFEDNLIAHFKKEYRIVTLTLPGHEENSPFMQAYREGFATARSLQRPRQNGERSSRSEYGSDASRVHNSLDTNHMRDAESQRGWAAAKYSSIHPGDMNCMPYGTRCHTGVASDGPFEGNGLTAPRSVVDGCHELPYQLANAETPLRVPATGFGFDELVSFLEMAVDTAMRTHNYCPVALPDAARGPQSDSGARQHLHQQPPTCPRPVLIAHGWGCHLAFELLLARPRLFDRVVVLDEGASVFGHSSMATHSGGAAPNSAVASRDHSIGLLTRSNTQRAPAATDAREAAEPRVAVARTVRAAERLDVDDYGPRAADEAAPATVPSTPSLSTSTRPRGRSHSQHATAGLHERRSLASAYAIPAKRTNSAMTTNVRGTGLRFLLFLFELLAIACTLLLPSFIGRRVLGLLTWCAGRPRYSYSLRARVTPETEAFNQHLFAQQCTQGSCARGQCRQFSTNELVLEGEAGSVDWRDRVCSGGRWQVPLPETLSQTAEELLVDEYETRAENAEDEPFLCVEDASDFLCDKLEPQTTTAYVDSPRLGIRPHHTLRLPPTEDWQMVLVPFVRSPGAAARCDNVASTASSCVVQQPGYLRNSAAQQGESTDNSEGDTATGATRGRGSWLSWFSRRDSTTREAAKMDVRAQPPSGGRGRGKARQQPLVLGYRLAAVNPYEFQSAGRSPDDYVGVSASYGYRRASHVLFDSAVPAIAAGAQGYQGGMCVSNAVTLAGVRRTPGHYTADGWLPADGMQLQSSSPTRYCQRVSDAAVRSTALWEAREIYYRTYYLPPACKDSIDDDLQEDEEALRRMRAAVPRSSEVPKDAVVFVDPRTGWIYLRYWLGVILAFFFTPKHQNNTRSPVTPVATSGPQSPGAHRQSLGLAATAEMRESQAYSPLVSQRYFFPIPVPVLYLYGGNKLCMLHSGEWCDYVRHEKFAEDGISAVVEVQGGGHWFFAEKKYRRKVAERVAEFLTATVRTPSR